MCNTIRLIKFPVMPFGLNNAPATFCILMNKVLDQLLDIFAVIYLDDIVVYSRTFDEHIEHLRQVFQVVRENDLYVNQEKCASHKGKCHFWGISLGVDKCTWTRLRSRPSWIGNC